LVNKLPKHINRLCANLLSLSEGDLHLVKRDRTAQLNYKTNI